MSALDDLPRLVFEAVGEASMCWQPRLQQHFDTDRATKVAEDLIAAIRAAVAADAAPAPTPLGEWQAQIEQRLAGLEKTAHFHFRAATPPSRTPAAEPTPQVSTRVSTDDRTSVPNAYPFRDASVDCRTARNGHASGPIGVNSTTLWGG